MAADPGVGEGRNEAHTTATVVNSGIKEPHDPDGVVAAGLKALNVGLLLQGHYAGGALPGPYVSQGDSVDSVGLDMSYTETVMGKDFTHKGSGGTLAFKTNGEPTCVKATLK